MARGNIISRAVRTVRLAIFGRQTAGHAIKESIMDATEELDPRRSDPRFVAPVSRPASLPDEDVPRSLEPHTPGPHTGTYPTEERHLPRD